MRRIGYVMQSHGQAREFRFVSCTRLPVGWRSTKPADPSRC